MYVLVKTHKKPPDWFDQHVPLNDLKVRPIISCSGSPTERLAWLVTEILSPLLNFIPCHLKSLHQHLEDLRSIPADQLAGNKFFSADVSSLYTNINITRCIENLLELAEEHIDELDLMGLTLTDVHMILEHILSNSYFTFDHNLYRQLDGLFMGLRPSPVGAVVRMYHLEKNSIYIDIHYLPLYYKRYIDDGGSLAKDKESALALMNSIAAADEDGKIEWEVDFPEDDSNYIPFLNTEINIRPDGTVSSRLFRKPTKKWITLHNQSHHPDSVKVNTIRNSYVEARKIASGPEELEYSLGIVDRLFKNNGFSNPRQYDTQPRPRQPTTTTPAPSILTLDFISQNLAYQIKNEVRKLGLAIKVNFTSKNKLRNKLCSSRPFDKRGCVINNCDICPKIVTINKDCSVKNVVYLVTCLICLQFYLGESERTAHDRLGEHLRYAKFPTTPSNMNKALAVHYRTEHPGVDPNLSFDILNIEPNTVRRKIFEAILITNLKPTLNLKEELKTVLRFLTARARV